MWNDTDAASFEMPWKTAFTLGVLLIMMLRSAEQVGGKNAEGVSNVSSFANCRT